MSDRNPTASKNRSPRSDSTPRTDNTTTEEDRPLAEVRKTIFDALRILTLHKWAFFIPFSLVASGAFIASLYYPRTYTASTSFERRSDPVIMNLPMSPGAASFNHFRSTMERDLTSVSNIAEAVDRAGLSKKFDRDEAGELTPSGIKQRNSLASSLAGTLNISKVSPNEQLDILTITYTGPEPSVGKALVDQLKKVYIAHTMIWVREFLENQREYLSAQSADALEELKAAQRDETKIRLDNPFVDPTDPGSVVMRLSQLEIESRELQLRRRELETELVALEQMLAASQVPPAPVSFTKVRDLVSTIANTPAAARLYATINEVQQEVEKLRNSRGMTDHHPKIQELLEKQQSAEKELDALRSAEQDHVAVAPNASDAGPVEANSDPQIAAPWNPEVARLKVQIDAHQTKLREIEHGIDTNNAQIESLRRAKDDVYQNQEQFAEVIGRVQKSRGRHQQLESAVAAIEPTLKATEQGRLIQFSEGTPARGGVIPINPKATTIVFLALVAGAIAGAILVVLSEVFDHVFRTSAQVARSLGVPILEAIDEIVTTTDRRKMLVRHAVFAPIIFLLFASLVGGTGFLAYASIQQPWTYERLRKIPARFTAMFDSKPSQSAESSDSASSTAHRSPTLTEG